MTLGRRVRTLACALPAAAAAAIVLLPAGAHAGVGEITPLSGAAACNAPT